MQHAAYSIKRYSLKLKAISVPGSRYMLHTLLLYYTAESSIELQMGVNNLIAVRKMFHVSYEATTLGASYKIMTMKMSR